MKRRLDGDQGHAAVAPRLRGALTYQVRRLAAGAVPPGRRWGERRVDLCSALMCVRAAQGKVGTERDARDFGGPDGKQQMPQAAPEEARTAGAAGSPRWAARLADRAGRLGAAVARWRRVQATEGGQRFAHVLRNMRSGTPLR